MRAPRAAAILDLDIICCAAAPGVLVSDDRRASGGSRQDTNPIPRQESEGPTMRLPSLLTSYGSRRRAGITIAAFATATISLTAAPAHAASPVVEFTVINAADRLCLDANDAGPTAGQSGDKIQLWTCTGAANQSWIGHFTYVNGVWKQEIHNAMYPNMCISLTQAPAENAPLTLQPCAQYFALEYIDWYDMVENQNTYLFPVMLSGNWVMAAEPNTLGPGDQVASESYDEGSYQHWLWTSRNTIGTE
jgi:hypothetical protein